MNLQLLNAEETATRLVCHSGNEHQQSVNDFQLCIMGIQCSNWLQTSMNDILTALRSKNSDMLPAAS